MQLDSCPGSNRRPAANLGKSSRCFKWAVSVQLFSGENEGTHEQLPIYTAGYSYKAPLWLSWKESACNSCETWVPSLGWDNPLEYGNGYPLQHTCLRVPWTLMKSMQRVGHCSSDSHFHCHLQPTLTKTSIL